MDAVSLIGSLAASSPPLFAGFLLGLITSVSPCPLGSNLAAIAVLSKDTKSHYDVAITSFAYSAGRSLTYILASIAVGLAGTAVLQALAPLQSHYDLIIALIMGIAGLMLLEKISFNLPTLNSEKLDFLTKRGLLGAFLLGAALAIVFCPVSAALFIGGVIPLVLSTKDWLFIPIAYGIGTAIPVLLLSQAIHATKKAGNGINLLNTYSRTPGKLIGAAFLLAGLYYLIQWIF
ncbi:TPA: sulfite exporter TauE/SafE family protein [Candidatus Micrarchaeota archaeon]|nr:sulfite exporter TauE/SafE family protein [Candidatus Micrarchaeota archaeon]